MTCSALNVDSNSVRIDTIGSRSRPYECITSGYPLENVRFLAREWLQIDTDLLRIITSTADELAGVPTSMTLNVHDPVNMGFKWIFRYFRLRCTLRVNFSLKYTGDRPRQPAYEIKLMLSRVWWALAQISCYIVISEIEAKKSNKTNHENRF